MELNFAYKSHAIRKAATYITAMSKNLDCQEGSP
jgi:hypothetical protein